jgi:hypothetical protein
MHNISISTGNTDTDTGVMTQNEAACMQQYCKTSLQQGSIAKFFIYQQRNYFFPIGSVEEKHVCPYTW